MNLGDLYTTTTVAFDEYLEQDELTIYDQPAGEAAQARVSGHVDLEATALREADPVPPRGSTMLGQLGILTSIFGHPSGWPTTRRYGAVPRSEHSALNRSRRTRERGFAGCSYAPTF
jgi:hypothetical protein